MKEFFSAKKNLILAAVIVLIAVMFLGYFLASFGMCGSACNIHASSCNPMSCIVDGCVGCTSCVGCVLGCN